MFELSLHILDLVQNSITAGATLVRIEWIWEGDTLTVVITDDGRGMTPELLARVESPFATTRKTRKVGLGIPMFKQLAEACGGNLTIASAPGAGTRLAATFKRDHVDLPPVGDLAGTMRTLILGAPDSPDFLLTATKDGRTFAFDTRQIRQTLQGVSLSEPEVLSWIGEYIAEGLAEIGVAR